MKVTFYLREFNSKGVKDISTTTLDWRISEKFYKEQLSKDSIEAIYIGSSLVFSRGEFDDFLKDIHSLKDKPKKGVKDSQKEKKPNLFTYCSVNKEALVALSERMQLGHESYEEGLDYENFKRVENADFEYSNAMFRHALGVGEDSEKDHLVATAWNAVAKLQIFLENEKSN